MAEPNGNLMIGIAVLRSAAVWCRRRRSVPSARKRASRVVARRHTGSLSIARGNVWVAVGGRSWLEPKAVADADAWLVGDTG